MKIKNLGIIGWRGMVGRILMERMTTEQDFAHVENVHLFSTSSPGKEAPKFCENQEALLQDAYSVEALKDMDVIISCQGGSFTEKMHPELKNWDGYWIDAASTLRMRDDAMIVLDPLNGEQIASALQNKSCRNFAGGNCTVSLLLMGLSGLLKSGLVEWISTMSYQAVSGAGARAVEELLEQTRVLTPEPDVPALEAMSSVINKFASKEFPSDIFETSLAYNLIPFVDKELENGQSREEWKSGVEANKILNSKKPITIDGVCVRVPSLRSHCQAFSIKLSRDIALEEIEQIVKDSPFVEFVPNNKEDTVKRLNPLYVSDSLKIAVGRLRKSLIPGILTGFTAGDQLLWGAAEPLRRTFRMIADA